jgi:hypothetical protein
MSASVLEHALANVVLRGCGKYVDGLDIIDKNVFLEAIGYYFNGTWSLKMTVHVLAQVTHLDNITLTQIASSLQEYEKLK